MAGSRSEILLVRHARAPWSPDESGGLDGEGRRDAGALADALSAEPVAAIYASPYARARETVEPLARRLGLAIREESELRERKLGGGDFDDFRAAVRATWNDFSFAYPGGETNAAAQRRVVAVLDRLRAAHPGGGFLIATHGNALALLLRHFDPAVGFDFWDRLRRPDAFRLRIGPDAEASFERVALRGAES